MHLWKYLKFLNIHSINLKDQQDFLGRFSPVKVTPFTQGLCYKRVYLFIASCTISYFNLYHTVPIEREWMKRVLKLLVWIFMLSRVGLVPGSNISKIYGLKFEKTQILEFSLQNDSFQLQEPQFFIFSKGAEAYSKDFYNQ